MRTDPDHLPPSIRRYVCDFVAGCRRVGAIRALLGSINLLLVWGLACCILDRYLALPAWVRTLLLAAATVASVALLVRPLIRLIARRVDWIDAAGELERRNPALRQRLVTVVSQSLAPPGQRGSAQLLSLVEMDLARALPQAPSCVSWRAAVPAAILLVVLGAVTLALGRIEWLNLSQLARRQLTPWRPIAPVTTTQLAVLPAHAVDVPEKEALTVRATVAHLPPGSSPTLVSTTDGVEWSRIPMTLEGPQAYTATLTGMEKDLRFHVVAGDAHSPPALVRVLRKPMIAEFRIRYVYPAYTARAALTLTSTDGSIEAPQGTEAFVSIVATEPLASAHVRIAGQRIDMTPGEQPNIRQVRLGVQRDGVYEIEMTSDRGVPGKTVRPLAIRAVPDRAPLFRMLAPATDLRLAPRDIVHLSWQAMDDYRIVQASLTVRVNGSPVSEHALESPGDARRKEGAFELDLATLHLKIGDVVTLALQGSDSAGQKGAEQPRNILISPRSIDATTHRRISELAEAARQSRVWASQLAQARQFLDEAKKLVPAQTIELTVATARASRQIGAAQETSMLVRQAILRAISQNAGPPLANALSHHLDQLVQQMDAIARVDAALGWGQAVDDTAINRLARATASANDLVTALKTLWEGEQAAALQVDLANLKFSSPRPAPPGAARSTQPATRDSRRQMITRAQQEIAASLAEMGINPNSSSVVQHLSQRIESARRHAAGIAAVDFAAAAQKWHDTLVAGTPHPPRFDERLYAASQAMALRADAELVGARDLNLAARASAALLDRLTAPAEGETPAQLRTHKHALLAPFVEAMAALQAEHDVNLRAMHALPSAARQIHDQSRAVHIRATEARQKLIEWASGPDASADVIAARLRDLEEMAMSANAATASRDFDRAAELDRRLASSLNRPDLADAARTPRTIDAISQSQENATQIGQTDPEAAAQVQEQVAAQLSQVPGAEPLDVHADTRQAATAAISAAQEKLAALPAQLESALQSTAMLVEASRQLQSAQFDLQNAAPPRKEAAQRIARQAAEEMDTARRQFEIALAATSSRTTEEISHGLRPFAPETSSAVAAIDEQLRPALDALRRVLDHSSATGDRAGIESAMQDVRNSLQQSQDALRQAQRQVMERDPLVAARWFARAAAEALGSPLPDAHRAANYQQRTLESLQGAIIDALRRSRNVRLSQVPSFAPFYVPQAGNWGDLDPRIAGERLLQSIPSLRQWGRLRQRIGDPLSAPLRESEPAGYADSLRLYFEVLGKEESQGRKVHK